MFEILGALILFCILAPFVLVALMLAWTALTLLMPRATKVVAAFAFLSVVWVFEKLAGENK